ncbi:MAG: type 1 glutamine amidotransferase domain-containing protein [Thermoproteota archaeon]
MMTLEGKKVAILAENGYEELELWYPYYRMIEEGATVVLIGSGTSNKYVGKKGNYPVIVDKNINEVDSKEFDALIIPGGWAPDNLRRHQKIIDFTREIFEQNKTVAAICHAGSLLVSANVLNGKTATCFMAIKDDMINAGINFVDEAVVIDGNLVTSRTPQDLPAFCKGIITTLSKQ